MIIVLFWTYFFKLVWFNFFFLALFRQKIWLTGFSCGHSSEQAKVEKERVLQAWNFNSTRLTLSSWKKKKEKRKMASCIANHAPTSSYQMINAPIIYPLIPTKQKKNYQYIPHFSLTEYENLYNLIINC